MSARQLSWLAAEGRQPCASIGGNIGADVVLTILEPLPSTKKLTEAVEER